MPFLPATPAFAWKAGAGIGQFLPCSANHSHLGQDSPTLARQQLTTSSRPLAVASGITAGAFGAHALAPRLGDKAPTWAMAAQYACFNGVALLAISQHPIYSRR